MTYSPSYLQTELLTTPVEPFINGPVTTDGLAVTADMSELDFDHIATEADLEATAAPDAVSAWNYKNLQDEPFSDTVAYTGRLTARARYSENEGLEVIGSFDTRSMTAEAAERLAAATPLVKQVIMRAGIVLPNHREDAFQVGLVCLYGAVQSYDPSYGVDFEPYAKTKILQALIDWIRTDSFIPRRSAQQGKRIAELRDTGSTSEEICAELDIDPQRLAEVELAYENRVPTYLADLKADQAEEGAEWGDWTVWLTAYSQTDSYDDAEAPGGLAGQAADILKHHKVKERDIAIFQAYLGGTTMTQLAEDYDVTLSRISQIFKKAAGFLRSHVEADDEYGLMLRALAA